MEKSYIRIKLYLRENYRHFRKHRAQISLSGISLGKNYYMLHRQNKKRRQPFDNLGFTVVFGRSGKRGSNS